MEQQFFFIIEKSGKTTFEFLQNSVKMEKQKIVNSLNSPENEYSKSATKIWYVIDSELKSGYSHEDPINPSRQNQIFVIILMYIF